MRELHDALTPAVSAGVLGRSGDIYTSPTGMGALAKWLLAGLPAVYSTKIVRLEHETSWTVFDDAGKPYGPFDAVVLAVPPVNAAEAVAGVDAELAETITSVRMLPRWVAMLAFDERLGHVPDQSMVNGQVLRRSKSNSVGDALVVEASQDWSIENVEQDAVAVGHALHELVRPAIDSAVAKSVIAHRWRYAFADRPLGQPYLAGKNGLFVCGDWCLGRSIESAWLSGSAAADAVSRA